MAETAPVIYWFRQDLRLSDLPGLAAAARQGRPVLPCFILDDDAAGEWASGGASRWWLHHSLQALDSALRQQGSGLHLLVGDSTAHLLALAAQTGATAIYCSRQYEPWQRELEQTLKLECDQQGIELRRFAGSLLWEPEQVATGDGRPYRVYTPFWKACRRLPAPQPSGDIGTIDWLQAEGSTPLEALALTPKNPDWAAGWNTLWQPGEAGAQQALDAFLAAAVADYREGRDHPGRECTSRLSPHLHWGSISPRRVWEACEARLASHPEHAEQIDKFRSELAWREFNHHLLYHFPTIPEQPFKASFNAFPWQQQKAQLRHWQRGITGYPIVDAGMRELWQTGYMHNRVRMIVASFLCKHLLLPWQAGQRWFWDTLLDANLANNSCGWQWTAGCGADAAPYFRVFNPTLQGEKFDAEGDYVRRWVPELARLPKRYLHQPWAAPSEVLAQADVTLGDNYPHPIVDHKAAREAALAAYAHCRES